MLCNAAVILRQRLFGVFFYGSLNAIQILRLEVGLALSNHIQEGRDSVKLNTHIPLIVAATIQTNIQINHIDPRYSHWFVNPWLICWWSWNVCFVREKTDFKTFMMVKGLKSFEKLFHYNAIPFNHPTAYWSVVSHRPPCISSDSKRGLQQGTGQHMSFIPSSHMKFNLTNKCIRCVWGANTERHDLLSQSTGQSTSILHIKAKSSKKSNHRAWNQCVLVLLFSNVFSSHQLNCLTQWPHQCNSFKWQLEISIEFGRCNIIIKHLLLTRITYGI